MFGTCDSCGTFVRGGPCPHCGVDRSRVGLASAAVLLLGLGVVSAAAPGCQAEYGVMVTDTDTDTDDGTGDTGDTGGE